VADRDTILETCGYAYNQGLVDVFDPDFPAYVRFDSGVPIGLLDGANNVLTRDPKSEMSFVSRLTRFACPWDLASLSWKDIALAWENGKVQKSAFRFQEILSEKKRDRDKINFAVREHIANLNNCLPPPKAASITTRFVWALAAGVLIQVGTKAVLNPEVSIAASALGGAAAGTFTLTELLNRRHRFGQAEVLRTGSSDIEKSRA
jgi:hypothetical protein